jgi:hypothetical protein
MSGHTVAQTVSRRYLAAECCARSQTSPCDILGGKKKKKKKRKEKESKKKRR